MSNQSNPGSRISLLSGLRTSASRSAVPHTAAPGGSFNIPHVQSQSSSVFPPEDDDGQNVFAAHPAPRMPMSAGFAPQQPALNPHSAPFTPFMAQPPQPNAFQMPFMQLELMKMQAAQQYQAQMLAQAQVLQMQQQMQSPRRASFNPPATAGPLTNSFDLRTAALSAQMRRATLPEEQVPMTASLDGRFGSRMSFTESPGSTTVISGGTSLGSPASNNLNGNGTPSKSDSASTWRRGGNNNSVLSGMNRSPSVKVTPPPGESPVPASPAPLGKSRPLPLSFNGVAAFPMTLPQVTIDSVDEDNEDGDDSASSASNSDPTTPSSNGPPLSPREEATKKLYEGLGIGRTVAQEPVRTVSQPVRQPRGPPQAADELGPKNFATRIRRKAIGGLGALMTSRERRESEVGVEVVV